MAEIGDKRIYSATFFTTQVDFADAGDLKVFVDAEQLKSIENKMAEAGYLDGAHMATAFNMLRPNDLIWSYWVNNYLKGKEPMAFDLLVWNSDSTRMPAANHKFYLRHCYLQNDLTHDRMLIEGKTLSLRKVTIPVYNLAAARGPHRAGAIRVHRRASTSADRCATCCRVPAISRGSSIPPTSRNISSGPAGRRKAQFNDWLAAAKETPGSWWVDWIAWLVAQAPDKGPGARARRGQAEAALRRAGGICEGEGVGAEAPFQGLRRRRRPAQNARQRQILTENHIFC